MEFCLCIDQHICFIYLKLRCSNKFNFHTYERVCKMKKLLLLLFIFSSLISAQNFNWIWQNSFPQGNNLNDAVILTSTKYICAGDKSTMMMSTNSGTSWDITYPDSSTGRRDIYEMSFPNSNVGYACGTGGLIMKTTNGGSTWNILSSPTTQILWYVHFLDADTGYICGNASTLYKTTNGGASWNQTTLSASTTLYKIYFFNNQIGYIGTGSATPGRLLKTTDYGATWNSVTSYIATGVVRGIYFLDLNTGFVTDQNYAVSKTTDGGATWNTQDLGTGTLYEVKFFDNNNGAMVGADGQVFVTSDIGTTWTSTNIGFTPASNVYGLAIEGNLGENPSITTMLAGCEAGVIASSSNLGATWTPLVASPTRDDFRQIEFISPTIGYASGGTNAAPNVSTVLKTTNAGQTWTRLNFDGGYQLYSHDWINANTGYVARRGPDGVYKTTDGGTTFVQQNPGVGTTTAIWYAMGFANADTGYIGNGSGLMAKTNDGGTSWTPLTSGHGTSPIYDIFIFNSQTLITIGSSAKIYKTTDGGTSWTPLTPTGITTTLYSVYFTSPTNGYVVGVSGKCYKTTNGGISWTDQPTGVTATLYNIMFSTPDIGWISGTLGTVLYTTDAGISWNQSSKFPSNGTIYGGCVIGQYIYFAGTRGNILRGYADPSLPVELVDFTASVNGKNINLNWQCATELNNRGFAVERKTGGGEYEELSFITGKGNSTVLTYYTYSDKVSLPGVYTYRLKQIDFDGSSKYSDEVQLEVSGMLTYNLEQNYPNPFNPVTTINFSIPQDGFIQLNLYNVLGEKVKELVGGFRQAGSYNYSLNALNLPSGIYLYRLEASSYTQTRKLIIMK